MKRFFSSGSFEKKPQNRENHREKCILSSIFDKNSEIVKIGLGEKKTIK